MKVLISLVVLLAFLGLAGCSENTESPVAPKGQASLSKVIITEFTAKDYTVAVIDPGVTNFENGVLKVKSMVAADRFETDNPLITGNAVNTLNAVYDFNIQKGTIAGTYVITPDKDAGGGIWEGVYRGEMFQSGPSEWKTILHGTGRGTGGTIEGMQYTIDLYFTMPEIPATNWAGTGQGTIKSRTF